MYKDSATIIEELLEESAMVRGMIAEILMKCKLLKSRLNDLRNDAEEACEEFGDEVVNSTEQMQADLDRYHQRLKEIYEELQGHGIIQ
jgi:predicted nuclease with TOPRIM domain